MNAFHEGHRACAGLNLEQGSGTAAGVPDITTTAWADELGGLLGTAAMTGTPPPPLRRAPTSNAQHPTTVRPPHAKH